MRVTGTSQIQKTSKVSARRRQDGSDTFSDQVSGSSSAEEPQGAAPAQSVAPIDALLFAQAADPDQRGQNQQRAVKSAKDVLDALEQVRRGLLLGAIPVGRLQNVARSLTKARGTNLDPDLAQVMDEILMRARVELAKAGIYSC